MCITEGQVTFLEPLEARRRKGGSLSSVAAIDNLLAWVDRAAAPSRKR